MAGDPRNAPTRRQALRIAAVAGIGLALGGATVSGLVRRARLHRVRATRTRMGTAVTVTIVHPDERQARDLVELAFAELERLEAILSRHRPGTAVHRLNRTGHVADAPTALIDVVGRALEYSALTDGAFDVTVAPLLELYTSSAAVGKLPTAGEVAAALARVGWPDVRLGNGDVGFERPGMAVTLDGIAKGYIVDHAVAALLAAGADRVMVDAGGDMATAGGGPLDEPWHVTVRHPRAVNVTMGVLQLRGEAVASSGDYVHSFTPDRRLHHILDPRTGRSPDGVSGVTVIARTAMEADALSTSVFVLGAEAGVRLLDRLDGVAGMVVTKRGEAVLSRRFRDHVEAGGVV